MTKEELKKYEALDDSGGLLTDPDAYQDIDMLAVRKYMKENNLKGPLTEEEIKTFRRP